MPDRAAFLLAVFVAALPITSTGEPLSYVEDFTSTAFRDAFGTTAYWDPVAGELGLYPFVASSIGSAATNESAVDLWVSGDHLYVADESAGLTVLSIVVASSPTVVGAVDTPGLAQALAGQGNHVFLGDGESGLAVIDVADPTSPTIVGSIDTPGVAADVAVDGNHAYVADSGSGLQIVEVSAPSGPTIVGAVVIPGTSLGVLVAGDIAYVGAGDSGVQVVDISDPTMPSLVGSVDTPGTARGLAVSGDRLYVADGSAGLRVVNVSSPASPVIEGAVATPDVAHDVRVSGRRAFVATGSSGLQIVDVTDPGNPVIVDAQDTPGDARALAMSGHLAYVADSGSGLDVIEIEMAIPLTSLSNYDTSGSATSIVVSGDVAFVADYGAGIVTLDVSDPSVPMLLDSYDTPNVARDLALSGDVAYVADGTSLVVLDVSDPTNLTLLGTYAGNAQDVAISGNTAYVADGGNTLLVLDVSDPSVPTLVGSLPGIGADGVAVAGDVAYVASDSGLSSVDVSVPSSPVLLGSLATADWARKVTISGDVAYVAARDAGLLAIDVSDPAALAFLGAYDTPGSALGVAVAGDLALVADWTRGLVTLDVTDPTSPTLAQSFETPGSSWNVATSGDDVFLADGNSGLYVLQGAQRELDPLRNEGLSIPIDTSSENVAWVRVSAMQVGAVTWEISADGGSSWLFVSPHGGWSRLPDPGSDLVWHSSHTWVPTPGPDINPTVSHLQIDWYHQAASIDSIVDVPEDQGGWVRLYFTRSGYDFEEEWMTPITTYVVQRRVDDAQLVSRVRTESLPLSTEAPPRVPAPDVGAAPGGVDRTWRRLEERVFFEAVESRASGGEADVWEILGSFPAFNEENYVYLAPTVADSSETLRYSVYRVTAHTEVPSVWFASLPDSGYSVDNIAPSVPTGLALVGNDLSWDAAPESDFEYHTVYGSAAAELDPTATVIGYTVVQTFDVSGESHAYYHVTTSDHVGNESGAASVEGDLLSSPDALPPSAFVVSAPGPNPFRGHTSLSIALPEAGKMRIVVYDTSGRAVRTLVDETYTAAVHRVVWDGRDDGAWLVGPGVYFARITAGTSRAERRLTLIR